MEQYEETIDKLSTLQKNLEKIEDPRLARIKIWEIMTTCQEILINDNDKNIVKAKEIIKSAKYNLDDYSDELFDDIDEFYIQYKKVRDGCGYCGYGNSKYVLVKFKSNGKFAIIQNWCGCLSYGPEYYITFYENKNDAMYNFESY